MLWLNVCSLEKITGSSQTNVPITKANFEEMQVLAKLEDELDKKKFFYPEGKETNEDQVKKVGYSLELNKEDVKIFHGVLKALIQKKLVFIVVFLFLFFAVYRKLTIKILIRFMAKNRKLFEEIDERW